MTRQEAEQLEEAIARVIHHERVTLRHHFDAELLVLREQIAAAGRQIAALEKALVAAIEERDAPQLDNVRFMQRRVQ